jgi:hypothetical protein
MILGLILSNALDVNSIIENWPYKPVKWTPVIIGTPSKKDEEILALTKTLTFRKICQLHSVNKVTETD